jgi:hypothetical protein
MKEELIMKLSQNKKGENLEGIDQEVDQLIDRLEKLGKEMNNESDFDQYREYDALVERYNEIYAKLKADPDNHELHLKMVEAWADIMDRRRKEELRKRQASRKHVGYQATYRKWRRFLKEMIHLCNDARARYLKDISDESVGKLLHYVKYNFWAFYKELIETKETPDLTIARDSSYIMGDLEYLCDIYDMDPHSYNIMDLMGQVTSRFITPFLMLGGDVTCIIDDGADAKKEAKTPARENEVTTEEAVIEEGSNEELGDDPSAPLVISYTKMQDKMTRFRDRWFELYKNYCLYRLAGDETANALREDLIHFCEGVSNNVKAYATEGLFIKDPKDPLLPAFKRLADVLYGMSVIPRNVTLRDIQKKAGDVYKAFSVVIDMLEERVKERAKDSTEYVDGDPEGGDECQRPDSGEIARRHWRLKEYIKEYNEAGIGDATEEDTDDDNDAPAPFVVTGGKGDRVVGYIKEQPEHIDNPIVFWFGTDQAFLDKISDLKDTWGSNYACYKRTCWGWATKSASSLVRKTMAECCHELASTLRRYRNSMASLQHLNYGEDLLLAFNEAAVNLDLMENMVRTSQPLEFTQMYADNVTEAFLDIIRLLDERIDTDRADAVEEGDTENCKELTHPNEYEVALQMAKDILKYEKETMNDIAVDMAYDHCCIKVCFTKLTQSLTDLYGELKEHHPHLASLWDLAFRVALNALSMANARYQKGDAMCYMEAAKAMREVSACADSLRAELQCLMENGDSEDLSTDAEHPVEVEAYPSQKVELTSETVAPYVLFLRTEILNIARWLKCDPIPTDAVCEGVDDLIESLSALYEHIYDPDTPAQGEILEPLCQMIGSAYNAHVRTRENSMSLAWVNMKEADDACYQIIKLLKN